MTVSGRRLFPREMRAVFDKISRRKDLGLLASQNIWGPIDWYELNYYMGIDGARLAGKAGNLPPFYYLNVRWAEQEGVTDDTLIALGWDLVDVLALSEHYGFLSRTDTPTHVELHVVVNLVHPDCLSEGMQYPWGDSYVRPATDPHVWEGYGDQDVVERTLWMYGNNYRWDIPGREPDEGGVRIVLPCYNSDNPNAVWRRNAGVSMFDYE